MRPNTPHAVVTPVPTIVRGQHFYATSTIQDTFYGILHTFARGFEITNADNRATCFLLLARLVALIHGHYVEGQALFWPPAANWLK